VTTADNPASWWRTLPVPLTAGTPSCRRKAGLLREIPANNQDGQHSKCLVHVGACCQVAVLHGRREFVSGQRHLLGVGGEGLW
jgi:hypothetical protein